MKAIKNLVSKINDQKLVKDYKITEAFFLNGEFYITSIWELDFETIANLEKELTSYNS